VRTPIILFTLSQRKGVLCPQPLRVSSSFFDRRAKEEIAQISKKGKKKQKETDFGKLFFNFHRGESREFTDLEYVITFATRRTSETLIPNINQKTFYFDVSFCAQLKEKHT
jgi:hypothetical protein